MVKLLNLLDQFLNILQIIIAHKTNYLIVPRPRFVVWEPTWRCNARCGFCQRWKTSSNKAKDELTTEQAFDLIKQVKSLGARAINISGGEPLLRKDIFEIARYARSIGLEVSINTNGSLITDKNAEELANSFDAISVSVDSVDPRVHDSIRGRKGFFDKAYAGLLMLSEYTKNVSANMVLTSENIDNVLEYADFFKSKGISISIQPVHSDKRNEWTVNLNINKFDKDLREKWARIYNKLQLKSIWQRKFADFLINPKSLINTYKCFAASYVFFIGPYGDIYPCETLRTSLGNIKGESLKSIWERMKKFRQYVGSNKRKCICWLSCTAPRFIRITELMKLRFKGI